MSCIPWRVASILYSHLDFSFSLFGSMGISSPVHMTDHLFYPYLFTDPLLYKPDSSSKAVIQKPDNHFTVSYTFVLFQSSLSSPASHLLLISPCFLGFLSDLNFSDSTIQVLEEKYFLDFL